MLDAPLPLTDRELLLEVRSMVQRLVESRDDHESRLRAAESSLADLKVSRREQSESTRRLIAVGMLLAACAGGFGNFLFRALTAKP